MVELPVLVLIPKSSYPRDPSNMRFPLFYEITVNLCKGLSELSSELVRCFDYIIQTSPLSLKMCTISVSLNSLLIYTTLKSIYIAIYI